MLAAGGAGGGTLTLGVMRLCWVLLLVLGWGSSPGAGTPDGLQTAVLIHCPNVTGEILSFSLLEHERAVCNYTCEVEQEVEDCSLHCSRLDVELHRSQEGRFDGFMVTASKRQTSYRCEAVVSYPPPYRKSLGERTVLLLVEAHGCGGRHNEPPGDEKESRESQTWPWIVPVVLLSLYCLAVTAVAAVCWTKLRRTEIQNDYMNAKPRVRAPKKTLLSPPRHF